MDYSLSQINENQRIHALDRIRGFAIFGIFMVNMLSFHSPFIYMDPLNWWRGPLEKDTYIFIDIFFQASFYPLFSMLFGYGLVLLKDRAERKGVPFYPLVSRRLALLLLFGCVHAWLIWHGDILFNYALFGFIFLLFIQLSGRRMVVVGSLFYLLPNIFFIILLFLSTLVLQGDDLSLYDPALVSQSIETYQNGTFIDITIQRIQDWSYTNNAFGLFMMFFSLFPLFLIGGSAAKYQWIVQLQRYKKGIRISFFITFIAGLFLKLIPYLFSMNVVSIYIQDLFGGPLLAISYGLLIAMLSEGNVLYKAFTLLSYVGRMSLSNYLFQSFISSMIFYSYGLGLYGKVSILTGTFLVLLIFSGQILLSKLWLQKYYYGPVEWLWRNFTYFSKQPLRREKKG